MSRVLMAIGLLVIVAGIGGVGYGVWTICQQHRVITSARPVMAKVLDHRTESLKASGFVSPVPLVKYEYTVGQQTYTCEKVTPAELMLPPDWADAIFVQFPIGAQIQANYDPNDPGKAFLVAKYSIKPYLPVLISLVIAGLGLGVITDQTLNRESPVMVPTTSGETALGAKRHHLASARLLGVLGIVGLVGGAPAIAHHLSVSTAPHERMGFLLEGAYGIAVLVALARSFMQFRQGAGFGTPVVTLDRLPTIGESLQVNLSIPTRFTGTASLTARLKCEAKDTSLFQTSEENAKTVLVDYAFLAVPSVPVTKNGQLTGTAEMMIPAQLPPSTPVASWEKTHVVWSLIVTAEGNGGRKAETEYPLAVQNAAT